MLFYCCSVQIIITYINPRKPKLRLVTRKPKGGGGHALNIEFFNPSPKILFLTINKKFPKIRAAEICWRAFYKVVDTKWLPRVNGIKESSFDLDRIGKCFTRDF
uniref:Uncharacterized protein n=1 Tax=Cacopsylla melanoneura TaxID=428564 RepID=A0A8D8WJU6_9HEMI